MLIRQVYIYQYFVRAALRAHGGNASRAAQELGVHRNTLLRYREQCGMPLKRRGPMKVMPEKKVVA